jgi:hypothetical protein
LPREISSSLLSLHSEFGRYSIWVERFYRPSRPILPMWRSGSAFRSDLLQSEIDTGLIASRVSGRKPSSNSQQVLNLLGPHGILRYDPYCMCFLIHSRGKVKHGQNNETGRSRRLRERQGAYGPICYASTSSADTRATKSKIDHVYILP